MSKSAKRLISQRWEEEFSEKMKKIALTLNITTTDLTVESLNFIAKLIEKKPKLMKDPKKRKELLRYIIDTDLPDNLSSVHQKNTKSKREHRGYIIDKLAMYLKQNEGKLFSSTDLSKKLDIPQPTVRTYIRNLAILDKNYKIIMGRPNFISYNTKMK